MRLLPSFQTLIALVPLVLFAQAQSKDHAPVLEQPEVPGPVSQESIAKQIEELLGAHHAIDQLSGSVLVADKGEVVYQGAFGMANSDWNIPNSADTKFRLASVTKQFTSMLTMLLVEDGMLELDAPLTKYLPSYPAASGDRVTLTHLLNHTSGIPSYTDRQGFFREEGQDTWTVEEFLAKFCSDPLDFDPGTQYHYNNSGYFLLGAIIEAVTDKTYQAVLQERIFQPLGMDNTGYDDQYGVLANRATGYDDILGGRRVSLWLDMTTPYAAGALYSTVGDLWKWTQALDAKSLLDGDLERLMFTPGLENYGFGWDIQTEGEGERAGLAISHSGGMPGVSTLVWRMPELDRTVIILCNASSPTFSVKADIVKILDGLKPRMPAPRGDFVVASIVLAEGIEAAQVELARWPQVVKDEYIENDVNRLGYSLLEQRRLDEAIMLFEFLTATYPTSANTWDSLGEAHLAAGHVARAIENYTKALELDPENALIPGILEKLAARKSRHGDADPAERVK
jgi:CubicO group peptidase (beta-lactamase class C family)